ncbi:uncharacterized protein LOC128954969 [Oppia nitens]|uniref:uncharacterized protein LOC128954969 n=1 Tax=Oppia nitens TaxID=1686743 RepID=UPI0023DC34D4|nr:uncharacterized protein LOC128954969 [Oppia nitens]
MVDLNQVDIGRFARLYGDTGNAQQIGHGGFSQVFKVTETTGAGIKQQYAIKRIPLKVGICVLAKHDNCADTVTREVPEERRLKYDHRSEQGKHITLDELLDNQQQQQSIASTSSTNNNNYYYNSNDFRELHVLLTLKSPETVNYLSHWFESELLYIQMEWCDGSLRDLIDTKTTMFKSSSNSINSTTDYYYLLDYHLSWLLTIETLGLIKHLHQLMPAPIAHRDIKPENIMFVRHVDDDGVTSDVGSSSRVGGRLQFKIGDFGLAKIQTDLGSMTGTCGGVGTFKYQPQEVFHELAIVADSLPEPPTHGQAAMYRKYNPLAVDIYSAAIVIQDIFDIYIDEWEPEKPGKSLGNDIIGIRYTKSKEDKLMEIIERSMNVIYNERPNIQEMFDSINKFKLNDDIQ